MNKMKLFLSVKPSRNCSLGTPIIFLPISLLYTMYKRCLKTKQVCKITDRIKLQTSWEFHQRRSREVSRAELNQTNLLNTPQILHVIVYLRGMLVQSRITCARDTLNVFFVEQHCGRTTSLQGRGGGVLHTTSGTFLPVSDTGSM